VREKRRPTTREPTTDELERWVSEGWAEAVDGCVTEPDGYCKHSKPSWLLYLGLI